MDSNTNSQEAGTELGGQEETHTRVDQIGRETNQSSGNDTLSSPKWNELMHEEVIELGAHYLSQGGSILGETTDKRGLRRRQLVHI
jgi:hypothetical protein